MAIFFMQVLPRHSFTAALLGELLGALGATGSVQASWEQAPRAFPLQSAYHLLQRFRQRLAAVRTALLSRCPPPPSLHRDPLRQTAEHLACAFGSHPCAIEAFQYTFQTPLMG
jgi:hypothetical protein